MKIAIASNNGTKFISDFKDHWEKIGHEVKYEMGASEFLAQWADWYLIDFWDNNIHYLYNWYQENPGAKKPKFLVRAVDWEVWQGLARNQDIIDWVDVTVCIAPHIEKKLRSENRWDRLHLIKCGVDTDKFTFREKEPGYNIVLPCNEIDWVLKNVTEGIKIFAMLVKNHYDVPWNLYIKGKWTQGTEYFRVYIKDLIEKTGAPGRVHIIEEQVPDYNAFLEQMDYCLVPSYKEAYSYVTAECASKGIIPIINWWYGAENLWPMDWIYFTPDEAVTRFTEKYDPKKIRQWIIENSNVKDMLKQYDQLMGI